ncbi:MAG: methyltransferase domain-containing protein [Candidatus Eremiobacteraeota bacterium]|nr:methyltransferase domain-containing protein [Candidatus Eremiobacteraeota bacterium]
MQRFERLAAAIARYSPGPTILEIGSGDGELANLLISNGCTYTGIDRNARIDFPVIIARDLFDYDTDQRFDCVVTQYVLHHATNIKHFVDRMLHFTNPKGIIAIGEYGWERSNDPTFRKERADLHTSKTMLHELDHLLERIHYEDVPYKQGTDTLGFIWLGHRRS